MYTIGQVSERFDLPVSTLRYYDKEGLFREIRQFMEWCAQGSDTYPQRHALFVRQAERVEAEIERLQKSLDMIRFKCWFYEQLMRDGDEARVRAMLPDHLPADIQKIYDHAHET